jgi:hypothetical protein
MNASPSANAKLRATLIKLPDATPGLLIVAGMQKTFWLEGTWQAAAAPVVGMTLEVELTAEGEVARIFALDVQQVALEQGKQFANLAQHGLGIVTARMGKLALSATLALWLGWFFLPAFDLGFASLTLWNVLGVDTSSAFTLMRGTSGHGVLSLVGLLALAAPAAVPFLKSARASWLYAAPLAFLLLLLAKVGLGIYQANHAAAEMQQQLGGGLNEAAQAMQSAAQEVMLKSLLSALGWGLLVVVLASVALFVQALRLGAPLLGQLGAVVVAGARPPGKPIDRRVVWGIGASVVALAVLVGGVSLAARLLQKPEARAKAVFEDLSALVVANKGDCNKLGSAMKGFFEQRADDFEAITKLPEGTRAELEIELLTAMQKSQNAIGNSFAYCANYREFAAAVTALKQNFRLVGESLTAAKAVGANARLRAMQTEPPARKPVAAAQPRPMLAAVPNPAPEAAAPPQPAPEPVTELAPVTAVANVANVAPPPTPAAALPANPTPSPASAPLSKYAVFDVPANDVLNARAQPNATAGKVFELAPASAGWAAANTSGAAGNEWLELQRPGGNGWVNRAFLVEEQPNPCGNASLAVLVEQFVAAVQGADGPALRTLTSPVHGLQVRVDIGSASVRFKQAETATLFTSASAQAWTGASRGSFKDVVQPPLLRTLATTLTRSCGKIMQPSASNRPTVWPPELRALTPFSLSPAPAAEDAAVWVLGIELLAGEPKLAALVEYAPPPSASAAKPTPAQTKLASAPVVAGNAPKPAGAAPAPPVAAPAPPAAAPVAEPAAAPKRKRRQK